MQYQILADGWICVDCKVIITNFQQYKQEVRDKQNTIKSYNKKLFKIKEEPDIAEVFLNRDPFADDYIKEEPQQEVELKHEPEVLIHEDENKFILNLHKRLVKRHFNEACPPNIPSKKPKRSSTAACFDCGIILSPDDLIQHRIDAHLSEFICDICYRAYRTKNSLLKHIRHHITEESQHKCDPCSKIFVNKKELITHNNRCHSNGNIYICDHCENVFTSRKEMVRCREGHYVRKKSSKGSSRPCPICNKRMKSNSIYSHIRLVHNNERDQICQVCGKALKTSYDLKVHLR